MKIRITADSIVSLPENLVKENNIGIFPLYITLGDKSYEDDGSITAEMIYDFVETTKVLPKTAARNEMDYYEYFKAEKVGYDALIHFSISSQISATHNNAKLASEKLKNVFVIDTLNLTTGAGLLVLRAVDLLNQGMRAEDIVKDIEEQKKNVRTTFIIDKLDYLHKGGRCSSTTNLMSKMLGIKPVIEVLDGKMLATKKYLMSNILRVAKKYVDDILKKYHNYDTKRVFITYSTFDEKVVEDIKGVLFAKYGFEDIIVSSTGPTITSHCGKNTLGIIFMEK